MNTLRFIRSVLQPQYYFALFPQLEEAMLELMLRATGRAQLKAQHQDNAPTKQKSRRQA